MKEEYVRRQGERRAEWQRQQARFRSLSFWRLAVVAGGAVLSWYNIWALPLAAIAFIALLVRHEQIARRAAVDSRAIEFYERGIGRIEGRWMGQGESGARFGSPDHPYASDLDLFGDGSIFQLMNSARTLAGEETLASWLQSPGAPEQIRLRHDAVRELSSRLDLREDLAMLGEDIRAGLHVDALLRWGTAPHEPVGLKHQAMAATLSGGVLLTFFGFLFQQLPLWPMLLFILGELMFFTFVRGTLGRILGAAELPGRDLGLIAALLDRLQREDFRSELLRSLLARTRTQGRPAAVQIAKLRRLIEWRDQARNQMFAIAAEPLLWSVHFGLAIERWRHVSGPQVSDWLAAIGEFEALASLAGYAAEHGEDVWPELLDNGPAFDAAGLTHPLLGAAGVRNDVRLDRTQQLLLISGSNMSGKSTLMRAVGLNAVLAWAGAPVRARRLRISPLRVGASMRVQDNLLEGASRFYAEITRLRQIVDMAGGDPPLLFLLDELLSGTNSHDRLIGSEAVVRSLVARGAIGLVTTHDLALARIADELAPRAVNVHFEDHISDGRIAFDYRMRPGVVRRSNAIELMRSVGLEV